MEYSWIDPVIFRFGSIEFRWYGLMYVISFVCAYFLVRNSVKKSGIHLNNDDVADLIFYIALGVILGGRLGYIVFYNLEYYLGNPLKIFAVWEGGMSFHGGLLGTVLSSIIFAGKKKISFFRLADLCTPVGPIGLFLGRLGNFINGELFGRVTDSPWGIVFPGGGMEKRHPSQLYEAFLEGPVLFLLLQLLRRNKNLPEGVVFWSFIALYGLFRFLVEFTREPDQQIGYLVGYLTMGQLLSLPMFLFGIGMILYFYRKGKKKEFGS